MRSRSLVLLSAILAAACGGDSTGPSSPDVQAAALAGDIQFALPATELADPLQVMVIDAVTERPAEDVRVSWKVVQGSATVLSASSTTDERGIASTRVRLGAQLGTYIIEASAEDQVGSAPRFQAFAVERPVIAAIAPAAATAGQTVVITGQNFHPQADYNAVLFDGLRGRILSASSTRIEVEVPACVPTRTVSVQLWVGAVSSESQSFAATGTVGTPLQLQRGEVRALADASAFSCIRLPGGIASARYLVIPQNVATSYTVPMPFTLATYTGAIPVATPLAAAARIPAAERFENALRLREREWVRDAAALRRELAFVRAQVVEPKVGDRRSFNVLNKENDAVRITAEVKAVSARAILYQDVDAPAGGFTNEDFVRFGQLFDDPIYDTDVAVFGSPSDIDANGKVIILFTPRVNLLTAKGESSVIAGYFYGCDLVSKARCGNTNSGEIFYSLVPDPQARYGDVRTTTTVLRTVLPVIAHEFQHMVNFANRDETLDALWLSEGLAHTAEDVVGQVFEQRGDPATARDFTRGNYVRASRFLQDVADVSMIATEDPGTLELRGGAWLLLRYLRAHYGGDDLLRRLTQTTLSSTSNITTQTGQPWARLLGDFAVALFASENAELAGVTLEPRYTFGSLPVRQRINTDGPGYLLVVNQLGIDAGVSDELPPSSSSLFLLNAPANTTYAPINLVFSGPRGGPFSNNGSPQLMLMRVR